jgi:hypothetical protein
MSINNGKFKYHKIENTVQFLIQSVIFITIIHIAAMIISYVSSFDHEFRKLNKSEYIITKDSVGVHVEYFNNTYFFDTKVAYDKITDTTTFYVREDFSLYDQKLEIDSIDIDIYYGYIKENTRYISKKPETLFER